MASRNKWSVLIVEDAQRDFSALDLRAQKLVYRKLKLIEKNPLTVGRRLRISARATGLSQNRIVFTLNHEDYEVEVWAIGKRDQAKFYRSLLGRVQKLLH